LDNFTDVLVRLVLDEHMDVITSHLPRNNVALVLDRDLAQHIPR
jgi:hypothetical protein